MSEKLVPPTSQEPPETTEAPESPEAPESTPTPPAPAPAPEPLWKQQGYSSQEEAIADIVGAKAEWEVRAKTAEEELAKVPKPLPPAPTFDPEKADDPAYLSSYQQEVAGWQAEVMQAATQPAQPSLTSINAAIAREKAVAEALGIDPHLMYGVMESMAGDPKFAVYATTPEGVSQLGKMAREKLKPTDPAPAPEPEPPTDPSKQYTGGDGAKNVDKGLKAEDPEEKRQALLKKAVEQGNSAEVVRLAAMKGLTSLKK